MKTDLFLGEDLSYENERGNTRSPDDLSDCGNRIMWFCAGDYCGLLPASNLTDFAYTAANGDIWF